MVAIEQDQGAAQQQVSAAITAEEAQKAADERLLEKYSRYFLGSFAHSLDAKGRLVVPQTFREQLGEAFYIAPSFDFKSIALYPALEWAKERDRCEKLSLTNSFAKKYLVYFDALSYRDQECDNQGRVLLPAKIRASILNDEKDVEITGAGTHVLVTVSAKAEENFDAFLRDLQDHEQDLVAKQ